ncbi:MAG TPA: alpha-L-rhamnosidase N-terminal domain-containing protein, partial [Cyclobacteriaceae bacterium]
MKRWLLPVILIVITQLANAQSISPELMTKKWNAQWITVGDRGDEYGVYHFRKSISLQARPSSFLIHVSGDNRYKLFVNGVLVSLGPARSDLYHWNYETVDIASYLKEGNNVLAAVVWNFGKQRSLANVSARTGFILQGNTANEEIVNTNKSWKCIQNKSYSPLTPDLIYTYFALGPTERIDYNTYPSGWELNGYDDKSWAEAKVIFNGLPKGVFDWFNFWMLVPRTIPQMELTPQRFQHVRTFTGIKTPVGFPASTFHLDIAANTKVTLLLDQGHLTNAYPQLEFSRGKDALISLQYA